MNFIEAANKSKFIRRNRFPFDKWRYAYEHFDDPNFTWFSLMAEDWEAKPEDCKHEPMKMAHPRSDGSVYLSFIPECYHCHERIKAKEWIEE